MADLQEKDRIFMTRVKEGQQNNQIKLAVFLKGKKEHLIDLMGFLKNQKIRCSSIPSQNRSAIQEFNYFDDGFFIKVEPGRWSFYELKSFIQSYADSCREDVLLRETLLEEFKTCDEKLIFDDHFYVQLSREIDRIEERYYQENMSISLYLSGVLKLLKQNLQLYWAASKIKDISTNNITYLNHDPPSFDKKEIIKACEHEISEELIKEPIIFCDEHIADFFLRPGPFSPQKKVLEKFLEHVIMHIDAFIYGHLNFKMETYRLKCEIAELKRSKEEESSFPIPSDPVREQKTKKKLRFIMIGATHLSTGQVLSAFSQYGYDKKNVELNVEWDKYKSFDVNNLLAVRCRYDGVLLGPIPHRMKGEAAHGEDLIVQMQNEPDIYPPFIVIRDKRGDLKITKSSLKESIQQLTDLVEKVGLYNA